MLLKVLTIWEPWAWLIVTDKLPAAKRKDVENRGWETNYRGPLVIHSGKKFDFTALEFLYEQRMMEELVAVREHFQIKFDTETCEPIIWDKTKLGGISGIANLHNIAPSESRWAAEGKKHWQLRDAMELPFTPMNGRQGLWFLNSEDPALSKCRSALGNWLCREGFKE